VTAFTGLRAGGSWTRGPYLSPELEPLLPAGSRPGDFEQRVVGFDVQFSRGYLELSGEAVFSSYDVPDRPPRVVRGRAYYAELKYTWSPRVYTAVRIEENDYPFIRARAGGAWSAPSVRLRDVEAGVGLRIDARTLVKLTYRHDERRGSSNRPGFGPGYAWALQLSHRFNARDWFRRPE
jgi:hypothetical protein